MNYELAKKLKEDGFPHNWCRVGFDGPICTEHLNDTPSLSELIEACGDKLQSIIRRGFGAGDNWEVRSTHERFNATTIEEAVANLWLVINKK